MATLDESNILDAETINWRLIVYPVLAVLIIVTAGFGYYYYQQNQRQQMEDTARASLVQARTPAEFVKVADQFPHTDQATLALLAAADGSFLKRDYPSAIQDYQRVLDATNGMDPDLRNSAQLGLASSLEAAGKTEEAIKAYLKAAESGDKNPYASFAYGAAARLYDQRGDKDDARQALTEAAGLDSNLPSVQEAQYKLKEMAAAAQPSTTFTVPAGNSPPPAPAASGATAPAAPAK